MAFKGRGITPEIEILVNVVWSAFSGAFSAAKTSQLSKKRAK
jgi:hypothetical protein